MSSKLSKKPSIHRGKRVAIAIEIDHAVPWHHGPYQGVVNYAQKHGWHCVVDPYLVGVTGRSGVADYDGVVGRISAEIAEATEEHGIPLVNLWQNSPVKNIPSVLFDHREGARLAATHLIQAGYRRLGHLGLNLDDINRLETMGINDAIKASGRPVPLESIRVSHDFEASREGVIRTRGALTDWVRQFDQPVGVIVQACHPARYLAQICTELGLRVPHDVGIVVHIGDTVIVSHATPALSVVDMDYQALGYESAAMLDRLMQGEPNANRNKQIRAERLIVRESSDVLLCDDPIVTQALHYISEHCMENLRVEDVAAAINVSRRTLERRFDESLSQAVYAVITRLRIERIKQLLVETNAPLSTLAIDCDFSSASHFTRFFKSSTGMTPSAYRKQQRGATVGV